MKNKIFFYKEISDMFF